MKVTPWEVSGEINYNKLIKEFGVSKIDDKLLQRMQKHTKELHFMLRRRIFFAHRDLRWVLDEYEKGNKFFLYTGRAPSGKVHIGHLVPWVFTKWLQDKFDVELLFKEELSFEKSQEALRDNLLDVLAIGFDLKKTRFLIDTKDANIMYKEACKVAKRITFSMVKSSFGLNERSNIGSIFYTSMQAVPAFLPSVIKNKRIPCLIPHAIDQDPHFRLTRDILPKLGHYKPGSIQCSFLPPLQGAKSKMSSSSEITAVYTSDSKEEVAKKINKYAFSGGQPTIEAHRKLGGNPETDVSFQYLKYLFEEDDKKLKEIEEDYKSGRLLTGELKSILIEKINSFLKQHNEKKQRARKELNQ